MRGRNSHLFVKSLILASLASLFFVNSAQADLMSSSNYQLDGSVGSSTTGGLQNSTSYALQSTAGESVIGNGTSGSYILGEGYTATQIKSLELTTQSSATLGSFTPGVSKSTGVILSIQTDAPGYSLSVNQDHDLQSGANTIPAVSGSIAFPLTWSEGTTKGLGFSLASTNATPLPPKWSSGAAFAAFPASITGFYDRTGYTGGATDTVGVTFRGDIDNTQAQGTYSNTITWTGTSTP